MKVQRLKNIQMEAAKARQKLTIPRAISNQSKISRAYKDLELGFEVEQLDPDTRSNAELQQDRIYIQNQLRSKLKTLYGKDGAEIDAYVKFLQQNQVSLSDFNSIFPELERMGQNLTANSVIARSSKLLQNLSDNGTTTGVTIGKLSIKQLTDVITQSREMIKEQYETEQMSKEDANDYTHRLNAILSKSKDTSQLKDRSEMEAVGQRIANVFNVIDEEDRINELETILDNAFNPPQKSVDINEKNYNRAKSSRDVETPTVTPYKTPSKSVRQDIEREDDEGDWTPVQSKKKGRPKGSKNKQSKLTDY